VPDSGRHDGTGVPVGVVVGVAVFVGVLVGVLVNVLVGVTVGVTEGVTEGVIDGVTEGVTVGVVVGVGVGDGLGGGVNGVSTASSAVPKPIRIDCPVCAAVLRVLYATRSRSPLFHVPRFKEVNVNVLIPVVDADCSAEKEDSDCTTPVELILAMLTDNSILEFAERRLILTV
jgi:hypothetical protein